MLVCPDCRKRLIRITTDEGIFFECPECQGRAVGLPVVKRVVDREIFARMWGRVISGDCSEGVGCPVCERLMAEVAIPLDEHALNLDVCKRCRFLWFHPQEFEQLPEKQPELNPYENLPQKAREQMAIAEAQSIADRARGGDFGAEAPEEGWKWVPALLGMPVEHEMHLVRTWPWVTWIVAALVVIVWSFTAGQLENISRDFGLIPAEAGRYFGLTFLTSFFLHGGYLHLIGNMYFLLIFGDNSEDFLGHWRYLLLLFVATIVGDSIHILGDPRSTVPVIGASGGISGVIMFYALQFPGARLGFVVRFWYTFRWIYIPAWFALICWLLIQMFGVYQQLAGFSNVSALAHLGGASVGFVAWLIWRNSRLS